MGIKLGFIATRSGLMRFSDHSHLFKDPDEELKKKKKKKKLMGAAADEAGAGGDQDERDIPEP